MHVIQKWILEMVDRVTNGFCLIEIWYILCAAPLADVDTSLLQVPWIISGVGYNKNMKKGWVDYTHKIKLTRHIKHQLCRIICAVCHLIYTYFYRESRTQHTMVKISIFSYDLITKGPPKSNLIIQLDCPHKISNIFSTYISVLNIRGWNIGDLQFELSIATEG